MNFILSLCVDSSAYTSQFEKLRDEINQSKYAAVVFNVFDTLLLMPYLKWEDFFQHLELIHSAPDFAQARSKVMDLPIDKTYGSLPSEFKHMQQKEMELLATTVQLNPEVYKLIQAAVELNKKVVLSAVCPYSKQFVLQLLKDKNVSPQMYDQLYVHNSDEKRKNFMLT